MVTINQQIKNSDSSMIANSGQCCRFCWLILPNNAILGLAVPRSLSLTTVHSVGFFGQFRQKNESSASNIRGRAGLDFRFNIFKKIVQKNRNTCWNWRKYDPKFIHILYSRSQEKKNWRTLRHIVLG